MPTTPPPDLRDGGGIGFSYDFWVFFLKKVVFVNIVVFFYDTHRLLLRYNGIKRRNI